MDEKTAYEEAGRVHRYFLNWRHAAFAGYFVILYAVASLCIKVWENPGAVAAILLLASPIGFSDDRADDFCVASVVGHIR
jgi:hypothetical protein